MNLVASIILVIPLTLSARFCTAWAPIKQQSTFPQFSSRCSEYSARLHSDRCYFQQRSSRPNAEDEVQEKQTIVFPWTNGNKKRDNKSQSMKDHKKLFEGDEDELLSPELLSAGAVVGLVSLAAALSSTNSFDISSTEVVNAIKGIFQNPSAALNKVVSSVESMGPLGAVYFGLAYTIAEVLAIPAIPLTASAGYLFGPVEGTAVVLLSASSAAAISFIIGRTFLREYVESILEEYPKFAKIDRAIGKEGFKLMLVLRLSPVFPFALSNYLYGASSINFSSFFWGTLFGFAPGTIAYVCTGAFGKALSGGETDYPWYVYAGGLAVLGGIIKLLADTANTVIEEMEDE